MPREKTSDIPVVVTGMGMRTPIGNDAVQTASAARAGTLAPSLLSAVTARPANCPAAPTARIVFRVMRLFVP
jgi:hypothetical protein